MQRIFLDANVLLSAAYRPGAGLVQLGRLKDTRFFTSRYAHWEATANLECEEQRLRLDELSGKLQFCEAGSRTPPREVSLPDKDMPILLAALAASCTHLLTGDLRHFGPYLGKKIEGMFVTLPGDYLKTRHRESIRE